MIGRVVGLLMGTAGAVTASQFPEYVQQYTQRLGGAVDELSGFVAQFDSDARASGMSRDEALGEYARADSAFLDVRGIRVVEMVRRYEELQGQKARLEQAAPFERLYVFLSDYEPDIAERAYGDFEPAIPVTVEGLGHAGAGFLAGGLLFGLLAKLALRPFRRRKPRRIAER